MYTTVSLSIDTLYIVCARNSSLQWTSNKITVTHTIIKLFSLEFIKISRMSFLPHDWIFKNKFRPCVLVSQRACGMRAAFKYPPCIPHCEMVAPGLTLHPSSETNNFSLIHSQLLCACRMIYRYEKLYFRFFVILFHVCAIFIQTHSIMLEHMPQLPSLSLIWFTDPPC